MYTQESDNSGDYTGIDMNRQSSHQVESTFDELMESHDLKPTTPEHEDVSTLKSELERLRKENENLKAKLES